MISVFRPNRTTEPVTMEKKTARLTVLVDPHKKKAFDDLCAAQDLTPSQVVRQLIRDYLQAHGVTYKTQSTLDGPAGRWTKE